MTKWRLLHILLADCVRNNNSVCYQTQPIAISPLSTSTKDHFKALVRGRSAKLWRSIWKISPLRALVCCTWRIAGCDLVKIWKWQLQNISKNTLFRFFKSVICTTAIGQNPYNFSTCTVQSTNWRDTTGLSRLLGDESLSASYLILEKLFIATSSVQYCIERFPLSV